jgi:hypothetical protein
MSTPLTVGPRIARLRKQFLGYDLVCSGSLVRRMMVCGKPNCRCKKTPPQLHGPYFYWSRRHKGRLTQKVLMPVQARIVGRAIKNQRDILKTLRRWEEETVRFMQTLAPPDH